MDDGWCKRYTARLSVLFNKQIPLSIFSCSENVLHALVRKFFFSFFRNSSEESLLFSEGKEHDLECEFISLRFQEVIGLLLRKKSPRNTIENYENLLHARMYYLKGLS